MATRLADACAAYETNLNDRWLGITAKPIIKIRVESDMAKRDKPEQGDYRAERVFWDTYRELRKAKGMDVEQLYAQWAAEEAQKLASPGAREDFAELCQCGCRFELLAAIIALYRYSPRLESFWALLVGPGASRQKTRRALENAAGAFEEAFGAFIATEDEQDRAAFVQAGRIPFSRMVSELRFYGRFILMAESLAAATEAHSLAEVSKYLLASYVKRTTGSYRDRNVSGILGEIANSPEFNEIAQRMWRSRNYQRLDEHFRKFAEFFVAMNAVMARPT